MSQITISGSFIDEIKQEITVDGAPNYDAWCSDISRSAGIGATTATINFPFLYADTIGDALSDKKIIVKAGMRSASKTVFIGYLSGKAEDISDSEDGFSMTAYTTGHYLPRIGVGEELNHWNYKYPLIDDLFGTPTGWTPALVLLDLFSRLPQRWTDEIALGDIKALTESFDLPVQSYDFSLTRYQDAIESIVSSLGDIAVKEKFIGNKCYLDFFRMASPNAPQSYVTVEEFASSDDDNVASISTNVTSDEVINRVIAFGTDKQFMITCKSVVPTLPDQSELINGETGLYDTALIEDWDADLEPMVLSDPKLANNDRVNRSLTIKGTTDPGTGGTTFKCDVGINLIPQKTILVHPKSEERMLVTGFVPKVDADPEADPPVVAQDASVIVTRLHQPHPGQTEGNLKKEEQLTIEVPGISNVMRQYRLPVALLRHPKREFLCDIPIIDPATGQRYEAQLFIFKSSLYPDDVDITKKTGFVTHKPSLLTGGNKDDFDKGRIYLDKAAAVPVTVEKTADGKAKVTYTKTVVGATFAYIDPLYPFGWNTGAVESDMDLPWSIQTERLKLDEFVYWQSTNTGWPVLDFAGNELIFSAEFINPKTEDVSSGYSVLRNDSVYIKTAAERRLSEGNRRHVSHNIDIHWADFGYEIGNQLQIDGLKKQPKDLLTITQVSFSMPTDGDHTTSITVDNVKPPARRRFNTKFRKAM